MTSSPLRVCFSLDHGFLYPTLVALRALIRTSRTPLEIHIIGVDLEEADWHAIETVCAARPGGGACLVRHPLASADHVPEVARRLPMLSVLLLPRLTTGRILYLDGDVLVTRDLAELFFRDMHGKPLSACKAVKNLIHVDLARNRKAALVPFVRRNARKKLSNLARIVGDDSPEDYINSGVVLLDLDRIRAEPAVRDRMTDLRAAAQWRWPDQTWLFRTFRGRIDDLELKWNTYRGNAFRGAALLSPALRQALATSARNAAIVHFVGSRKPWKPWRGFPPMGARWFRRWRDIARDLPPDR